MKPEEIIALVVDDSRTMVRIVSNTLKRLGITEVHTAKDGQEGFNVWKLNPNINIVFTDINMPIMNGFKLLEKIRKEDKDIPIIMITTEGGKREVIKALKLGANQYIIKPFTAEILEEKLEIIL